MCPPEPSNNFSIPLSPEDSQRTRQLSERRIQANRRNALRSTGPKTGWGKRTVARNAIKHGLLAREVVITAGDGEESLEEFHALTERLLESYEPVGVVEEARTNDCRLLVEESPGNSGGEWRNTRAA